MVWLSFCGTALGLFLLVPLIKRSRVQGCEFWLALVLLSLVLVSLTNILPRGASVTLPLLCALSLTPLPALGPLMFQVIKSAAGHPFRRHELWHFFPTLVFGIFHFFTAALILLGQPVVPSGSAWLNIGLVTLAGGYLPFGFYTVVEAHRRSRKAGVSGNRVRSFPLLWLLASTVLWGGWLWSTLSPTSMTKDFEQAAILVFFYLVGWSGLGNAGSLGKAADRVAARTPGKYASSGMTPQTEALVAERVSRFLEEEKAFLNESLTLTEVARKVGCSPHWVSQYLNGTKRTTFFDYINGLRVEEFIRLAKDPKAGTRTILDLSLAAGFRNKSTFNAAFKKKTGLTPRQWRWQETLTDDAIGAVDTP